MKPSAAVLEVALCVWAEGELGGEGLWWLSALFRQLCLEMVSPWSSLQALWVFGEPSSLCLSSGAIWGNAWILFSLWQQRLSPSSGQMSPAVPGNCGSRPSQSLWWRGGRVLPVSLEIWASVFLTEYINNVWNSNAISFECLNASWCCLEHVCTC